MKLWSGVPGIYAYIILRKGMSPLGLRYLVSFQYPVCSVHLK